jgi:glycosyltransferase involved in cell wall biosynthesis
MRRPVLLRWRANNYFGWGVLGLNLLQHWASDSEVQPLLEYAIGPNDVQGVDPLRLRAMHSAAIESNAFLEKLTKGAVDLRQSAVLVIHSLSNGLNHRTPRLVGIRNVGRCIFEDTLAADAAGRLQEYDSLLCGSEWGAGILRTISHRPVTVIHEGVDTSLFFPGPRSGVLDASRFYVFSGGKIEFRKAHDLVMLAFRQFAQRHDDAMLVAAWSSPWPEISAGFRGRLETPLQLNSRGVPEIQRWVSENGIKPQQFIELPAIPNHLMPTVLREMDCAVQVSRCEACTNLPAKEAMACGVPVILANNTGVRDLIASDNCVAMNVQSPVCVPGLGTDGWGESDVDEIVAALETLYTDTQLRKRIASRGAAWITERRRTWHEHAAVLKTHLLQLL